MNYFLTWLIFIALTFYQIPTATNQQIRSLISSDINVTLALVLAAVLGAVG